MAKKSMIARDVKRAKTVARFAAKRAELKGIIRSPKASDEERKEAMDKLKKLGKTEYYAAMVDTRLHPFDVSLLGTLVDKLCRNHAQKSSIKVAQNRTRTISKGDHGVHPLRSWKHVVMS